MTKGELVELLRDVPDNERVYCTFDNGHMLTEVDIDRITCWADEVELECS